MLVLICVFSWFTSFEQPQKQASIAGCLQTVSGLKPWPCSTPKPELGLPRDLVVFRLEGGQQLHSGPVYRGLPSTVCGNCACKNGRNKELTWRHSFLSARHWSNHDGFMRGGRLWKMTYLLFFFVLTIRDFWFWLIPIAVQWQQRTTWMCYSCCGHDSVSPNVGHRMTHWHLD